MYKRDNIFFPCGIHDLQEETDINHISELFDDRLDQYCGSKIEDEDQELEGKAALRRWHSSWGLTEAWLGLQEKDQAEEPLEEGRKCRQGAWHGEELKGEQGEGGWYKIRPWDHSEELGVSLKENGSNHDGF